MRYRYEVLRSREKKRRSKQMFLSSFRQNANAKIATAKCYQDTIVLQIIKKLDVTEKKQ